MEKRKKHSRKREAILQVIRSTGDHPGAQWVYDRLKPDIPDLSLGTVYRNISLFRREGTVVSLGVFRGEERFDRRIVPHPHAVCTGCGRIEDLPAAVETEFCAGFPAEIPGFAIDIRHTVFYGVCKDCSEGTTA